MPTNTNTPRARRWQPWQKQAALLRSQGWTWEAIAAETKKAPFTCRELVLWPEFNARVQELSDQPIEEALLVLKAHAREAAEQVVKIMRRGEAKRDEPRLAAAQDILDRMGVTAAAGESEQLAPQVTIDLDLTIIDAAQRAYIGALRAAAAEMGSGIYAGLPSRAGPDPVRALPVPGGLPPGPQSGADCTQGTADGHEPGGRP